MRCTAHWDGPELISNYLTEPDLAPVQTAGRTALPLHTKIRPGSIIPRKRGLPRALLGPMVGTYGHVSVEIACIQLSCKATTGHPKASSVATAGVAPLERLFDIAEQTLHHIEL